MLGETGGGENSSLAGHLKGSFLRRADILYKNTVVTPQWAAESNCRYPLLPNEARLKGGQCQSYGYSACCVGHRLDVLSCCCRSSNVTPKHNKRASRKGGA